MKDLIITFIIIFGSLLALYFLYRFFAPYFVRITTVFYVSGSMGTGKDVLSHKYAIARYRVALRKYKRKVRLHKFKSLFIKKSLRVPYSEKPPLFLSTIPVLIRYHKKSNKTLISSELTLDTILLKERMPHGSIVYISDINNMIDQWSYKNENVITIVSEYISMFRHYTKGGYIIVNSQGSFQVAKEIRGLFGKIRNNLSFKKFLFFYRIEGRTITMSEEVINVEQGDADKKNDNATYIYGFLNPFIRRYDTYAYYGRVANMSVYDGVPYKKANSNTFIIIPKHKVYSNVENKENDYTVNFKLDKLMMVLYSLLFIFLSFLGFVFLNTGIVFMVLFVVYLLLWYDAVT